MSTLADLNVPGVVAPKDARKARESDVIRSIDYRDFRRVRLNGNPGTLYALSSSRGVESLRDAYSNVVVLAGRSQYAPELSTRYVFVSDKRYDAGNGATRQERPMAETLDPNPRQCRWPNR